MSKTLPTTMAATVRASNEGLDIVNRARCKKGWTKTCQIWADLASTSQATLKRFWAGFNIQVSAFQSICETVGVEEWETIIDFDSTDSSSSSEENEQRTLSAAERLTLIQTLHALPSVQFNQLIFALNPPKNKVLKKSASQRDCSTALLDWAESSNGIGLSVLEALLGKILAIESNTAEEILSFAISGKINSETQAEVRAIVNLLRMKTGDDSIDVAFFKEGSIRMILTGSLEGLTNLQELFDSGNLADIENKLIEAVQYVDANTDDARKTRLVQALRITDKEGLNLDHSIADDLNQELGSARPIMRDLALSGKIDRNLVSYFARNSDLASNLTCHIDLASYIASSLSTDLPEDLYRYLKLLRDNHLSFALTIHFDLTNEHNHCIERAFSLSPELAHYFELFRDLTVSLNSLQKLDLTGADLTATNLRSINLRQANLTGADFTGADLTEANLTGAVLDRTILTGANVTRTIFGENPGLTDIEKLDLQRRGAILLDPPSSDVPSLISR